VLLTNFKEFMEPNQNEIEKVEQVLEKKHKIQNQKILF
jgi:hypothetical protein